MLKATLFTAAALLALPGLAQTAVHSASGGTVTSGTGVAVTPGVTTAMATVPVTTVVTVPAARLSGAVVAPAGTAEAVHGNTRTVTTRYWVNVPAGVEQDAEFQRWQRLR